MWSSPPFVCVCPQITLWGRIHVLGNSVPLFRKNPQLAVCFVAPHALQAKQGWMKFCGVEVYLMARLIYLFIYFSNKPFSDGCCHRLLPGLSRGNIRVLLIWLLALEASWLDPTPLFFLSCSCRFCSPRCHQYIQRSRSQGHENPSFHDIYFISLSFSLCNYPPSYHLCIWV